jgi:hypothetical protein
MIGQNCGEKFVSLPVIGRVDRTGV